MRNMLVEISVLLAVAIQHCSAWSVSRRPSLSSVFSKVIGVKKSKSGLIGSEGSSRCPFANFAATTADDASTDKHDSKLLLDRIGGEAALDAAVDGLYDRLIVDPKLAEYFVGVPMETLKAHQFNFMRLAFTEIPEDCDVAGILIQGHKRLWDMGLDESDFDCVAGHLVDTMQSLGVGQEEIDEAVGIVGPLRDIFKKDGHPIP